MLVLGAGAAVLMGGVLLLRVMSSTAPVADPPPTTTPAAAVASPTDATAEPSPRPTASARASAEPPSAEPPSAEPSAPPDVLGLTLITTAQFEHLFAAGRHVGGYFLVDGTVEPTDNPLEPYEGKDPTCDGMPHCIYGQLAGATNHETGRPLVVWARRIAVPLDPGVEGDEFWWPAHTRQLLPVSGTFVLRIDTPYSVEYVGRLGEDAAAGPLHVNELEAVPTGGPVDIVRLVRGWLGGATADRPCPREFRALPSNECGRRAWLAPDEGSAEHVPVQPGAYEAFAAEPAVADDGAEYAPRHGVMAVARRLAGDGCAAPPCPTWNVLAWLDPDFDVAAAVAAPLPAPVPSDGWIELRYRAGNVEWSPDGRWFLLQTDSAVALFDGTTAEPLRSIEFSSSTDVDADAAWLDSGRVVVANAQPQGVDLGDASANAFIASVSDAALTPVAVPVTSWFGESYASFVASGRGAVAFRTTNGSDESCEDREPCFRYRVWTPDGVSRERLGEPVAWSVDGSQLAVLRNDGRRDSGNGAGPGGTTGWLEIVSWPALEPVLSRRDLETEATIRFSPDGSKLIAGSLGVVDIATGRTWRLADFAWKSHWDATGNLVTTTDDGDVVVLDLDGSIVQSRAGLAHELVSTPDGRTQAGYRYDWHRAPPDGIFSVFRDGAVDRFAIPDFPAGSDSGYHTVWLAPGGHALVVATGNMSGIADRYLFRLIE